MNATHWLFGCALCVAGVGNAAAASMDTQDTDTTSHAVSDVVGAHDASGGDVTGLNHDGTVHSSGADATTGNTGNDTSHSGGTSSAPVHVRPSHLGWQSLLPGSIQ